MTSSITPAFSAEFGLNWTATGPSKEWNDVAMSSTGAYQTVVVWNGQIYTSTDYWVNLTAKGPSKYWRDVAMSSDGKYQTAVAQGDQIYTSTDYGVNWTARGTSKEWLGVAMSSDGKYQTAVVYRFDGQIYTSTDYGVNWIAMGPSKAWLGVAMSSTGQYQTAVSWDYIYTSTDYGVNWTAMGPSKEWRGVAMSSDGKYQTAFVNNNADQIYTSTDYWVNLTARGPTKAWLGVAMSSDGKYQTAVAQGDQIYTSTDYGVTWIAREEIRGWTSVAMSSNAKYQTAVAQGSPIYTSYYTPGPYTSGHNPAKVATGVAKDTNIVLHIKDDGLGVDQYSIIMTVEGVVVAPAISGTSADYTLSYAPASDFSYSQVVDLTIDASDLALPANVMPRDSYFFTIQNALDTTPPSAITDLSTANPSSTTVGLSWTAPGDDGNTGTASSYDIRYSTIEAYFYEPGGWDMTIQVTGEPAPSIAGTIETMTVTGLIPGTTYYFAIKTKDEGANESGLSNRASGATLVPPDTIPPSDITDFIVAAVTAGSATLTWSAPGDDANTGTASSYDLRYATSNITEADWAIATPVTGEPAPSIAGTIETMTITGLIPGTTYYFAIKSSDEAPNTSSLSNVANATTLTPSSAVVSVDPATQTVNSGDTFTLNVLVDPYGTNIAGAQADITFDPAILKINSISEGNLFKQGGASTFFFISKGIDNTTGKAGTVLCFILGASSISTKGTFFIINATALGSGTSAITLSNVKISDPNGNYVLPLTITNGSVTVSAPVDTTAPSAITDLAASEPTTNSALLTWTAPGDDANTGTASSYDLRYSTANITDANWASATQASAEPAPALSGTVQTMTVSGLNPATTYYFAIKTSDEAPNTSDLSNVVSINTLRPEDINQDGVIDIFDLRIVALHFGESTTFPYPSYDINANGIVDIFDIRLVAREI